MDEVDGMAGNEDRGGMQVKKLKNRLTVYYEKKYCTFLSAYSV